MQVLTKPLPFLPILLHLQDQELTQMEPLLPIHGQRFQEAAATITSPSTAPTTITGLAQGSYTFRLTVTDNSGATASDDVVVVVNAQPTPTYSV